MSTQLGQKKQPINKQTLCWISVAFATAMTLFILAARYPWRPPTSAGVLSIFVFALLIACCALTMVRYLLKLAENDTLKRIYVCTWLGLLLFALLLLEVIHLVELFSVAAQELPFASSFIMAALSSALMLRFMYIRSVSQQNLERSQIAHSQALAARIRPHFLFNTLNTIAALTTMDPKGAERSVEALAQLYRMSLAEVKNRVSLREEINTAQSYLDLEQYRLGDRLQQSWDLQNLPMDAEMPILTLQPLVENAVYHGIEPTPEGGVLEISGRFDGRLISICVRNPIPEIQRSNRQKGNNMAVNNIRERLKIVYGDKAAMQIGRKQQMFEVTIEFPYISA